MADKEILVTFIQKAVDGCAKNWAEQIADYLMEHGTYVPDKHPIDIIDEPRLTDPRFLNGWYEPKSREEEREIMYTKYPNVIDVYQRLGTYENLYEDGMLMQFRPIDIDSGENTF